MADQRFDVSGVAIVGRELEYVEHVRGRLTYWGGCSGCLERLAPSASHRFCCCRVSPLPSPSGIPCTPKFF